MRIIKSHTLILFFVLVNSLLFSHFTNAERSKVVQHDIIAEGITQLSPYFSIERSGGGWFSPLTIKTYHHNGEDKKIIGLTKFSKFASRQNAYAISDDGKTILYFHQNLPRDGGVGKLSGLYEYRHGKGDKLIHGFISNAVYLPIKLPRNIIVFAQLEKRSDSIRMDSTTYLRDTNGNERPWQP